MLQSRPGPRAAGSLRRVVRLGRWPGARIDIGRVLCDALAPPLILLTPFLNFLRYQNYDIWRLESLLGALPLIGFGLVVGALISLRPSILRPVLVALLIVLFLDFQFRANLWVDALLGWDVAPKLKTAVAVGGIFTIVFGVLSACWFLRRHLGVIVFSVFGVMAVTTAFLPADNHLNAAVYSRNEAVRADLPPIVHLMLDGQIGIEGLPADIPGVESLRRDLKALYERFGFTVFGRAFSRYASTYESMSNMMNGQSAHRSGANIATSSKVMPRDGIRLRENAWFRELSDQGYRIRVYQTNFLDFCTPEAANVDYCHVVPSNGIVSIMDADLAPATKTEIILNSYLPGSFVYRHLMESGILAAARLAGAGRPEWLWENKRRLGAISAVSLLDRIAEEVRAAPRGTAFFMHLLIPHGDYVFTPNCRLRPDVHTWVGPISGHGPNQSNNTPASRRHRYELYFDQVRCAHRKLAAQFERMEAAGLLAGSTVIVHGDHGSRITLGSKSLPAEHQSESDLIANHSTLFALRRPGAAPAYDRRQRALQDLFAETVMNRPRPAENDEIFIGSPALLGTPYASRKMPEFGNGSNFN